MGELTKMLDAISLQLILVIIIGIASIAITNTLYANVNTLDDLMVASANPLSFASLGLNVASIVAIAWAGYVWTKASKGKVLDGAKAGMLVSVVSGVITGYLAMIYVYPVLGNIYSAMGIGAAASMFGIGTYVIGILSSAFIGFILGAIGGYFGKGKK